MGVVVGVDSHKSSLTIAVLDAEGSPGKPTQLSSELCGFRSTTTCELPGWHSAHSLSPFNPAGRVRVPGGPR
jgi:hypothetical protein